MIPINPEAIGDPNTTPVVYVGEKVGKALRIRRRLAERDECRECDCEGEMPYDPNDPGAYPGPDEDCECECHG